MVPTLVNAATFLSATHLFVGFDSLDGKSLMSTRRLIFYLSLVTIFYISCVFIISISYFNLSPLEEHGERYVLVALHIGGGGARAGAGAGAGAGGAGAGGVIVVVLLVVIVVVVGTLSFIRLCH